MHKHLVAVVAIVVSAIAGVLVLLAIMKNLPDTTNAAIYPGLSVVLLLAIVPASVGYAISTMTFDPQRVPVRHYLRRAILIGVGLEVVPAMALVATAIIAGIPAWVITVIIAVSALLFVFSVTIGNRSRRREVANAAQRTIRGPLGRREAFRAYRIAAIVFVTTFAAGLVVLGALRTVDDSVDALVPMAAAIAAFTASVAVIRTVHRLRPYFIDFHPDLIRDERAITVAVTKGEPRELTDEQRLIAIRYATLMTSYLSLFALQQSLILTGVALSQFSLYLDDGDNLSGVVALATMVLVVATIAVTVVRRRRVVSYLGAHTADVARVIAEDELAGESGQ